MATQTGDSLDKLRKQNLIPIVLSLRGCLYDNWKPSFLPLLIFAWRNSLLTRLTALVKQCGVNAQYSRRECLDIVGIPREVSGEILEKKVLKKLGKLFGKLGCNISPNRTEACHRVGRRTDTVIVTFSKRKDCQYVWSVKKDLKNFTMEDLELPGNNKLFINRSFCPYYKMQWSKSKKLHSLSKIHSFFLFLVTRSRSGSMKIVRRCR